MATSSVPTDRLSHDVILSTYLLAGAASELHPVGSPPRVFPPLAHVSPNSLKYNLPWDVFLGLNVFPPDVLQREVDFYRKHSDKYGFHIIDRNPPDLWSTVGKLDVAFWTQSARYAEKNPNFKNTSDLADIVDKTFGFANDMTPMAPLTDVYYVGDARRYEPPCIARPVLGALWGRVMMSLVEEEEQQEDGVGGQLEELPHEVGIGRSIWGVGRSAVGRGGGGEKMQEGEEEVVFV